MSKFDYTEDSVERFKLVIEQLEVCADLIKSDSPAKSRMAIILLDNLIDILMYRYCLYEFSRDYFVRSFHPPKFTEEEEADAKNNIEGKIKIVRRYIKKLTKTEETIIRLCHSYRNDAQHNDAHNPATSVLFAKILFKITSTFFIRLESKVPVSIGYGVVPDWFKKYTDKSHIKLLDLAKNVVGNLSRGMGFSLETIRKSLSEDLSRRLEKISEIIGELPASAKLDEIFRYYGFEETLEFKNISKPFYQMRYRIVAGEPVAPEEYWDEEINTTRALDEALIKFSPSVNTQTISKIKRGVRILREGPSTDFVLKTYERFNRPMELIEHYLNRAAEDWDKMVQLQIDIARGK